ncbi:hypothetical protein [Chryseobacterium aquaticum]|uniref:hypothetical protein n=1 Tax=Chryseobacterium aquaticum TaxID=452084 RepID=UPI003F704FAC
MLADQMISVSDLRYKTKLVLESLNTGAKYVLLNNKLEAVILTPTEYEYFKQLQKAEEWRLDIEEAKKNSPVFDNAEDLLSELLA